MLIFNFSVLFLFIDISIGRLYDILVPFGRKCRKNYLINTFFYNFSLISLYFTANLYELQLTSKT